MRPERGTPDETHGEFPVILGVMSDTHGNSPLMHQVAEFMVRQLGAQVLVHLGDDYPDSEELVLSGYEVRRVPGLWCSEYRDHRIPNRIIEQFDGIAVAAVHAEKDLRHIERAAGVILLGHTHEPFLGRLGASLYVNPGHLKSLVSRGHEASFAAVSIEEASVSAVLYDVNGCERQCVAVRRNQLA
jgi:putative phosphoesterase